MTVALITGGNQGLGFELIKALGTYSKNYTLLLGARNRERGTEAVSKLAAEGVTAHLVDLDITDDSSIDSAVKEIETKYGGLDILVNNAGVVSAYSTAQTRSEFTRVLDTNLVSVAIMMDKFEPLLIKSKAPRVINLGSGLGSNSEALVNTWGNNEKFIFSYNASKAALVMLSINIRNLWESKNYGIKVAVVDPGYCATNLNGNSGPKEAAKGAQASFVVITTDNYDIPFVRSETEDKALAAVPF